MMTMLLKRSLVIASAVVFVTCGRDAGTSHAVNGEWVASLEIRGQSQEITFDLRARGERLDGEIRAEKSTKIVDGTIQGNDLSFKQVVNLPDGSQTTATYQGTLRGDEIDFTVVMFGPEMRFTATRRTRRVPQ